MSLFDRFLGREAQTAPVSPEALRERLFESVHSGDDAALSRLCAEHEAVILDSFSAWQTLPEQVRGEPASLQRHVRGLLGIAQCLAQTRDRPELLQRLMGPRADNPIARWQQNVGRAQEAMSALNFEDALALLTPEAERIQGLSGGSADAMKAMTLGKLATCHFQKGHAETALPLFQQALALCRTAGDEEGLVVSLDSLFETHRYLGQGAEAALAASELQGVLERTGQQVRARRLQTLADLVRRGEPLNRVVLFQEDSTFELDELPALSTGKLQLRFCRNRIELARCTARVQRGRELGQQERFEEALALFTEAGRLEPHSPAPRHEGAVTLLHLQRASEAMAWYDEVEALAPGWYHCRAERWLAAEIAAGRLPHQAFVLLRMLESSNRSAEEGVRLAQRALGEVPGVPEFQLHLGRQLAALGQTEAAREALTAGLQQAQEPDLRSRLLVESAAFAPSPAERERRLHEALRPGGNLIAAAMARLMLHADANRSPGKSSHAPRYLM